MTYFSKFPYVNYKFDDKNYKLATDILKRYAIDSRVKEFADIFILYQMKDGEKSQDIAYRLYGDARLHWVIYLMNNIIDPYEDLPVDGYSLEKKIQDKYQGYSLFLDTSYHGNFIVGETVSGVGTNYSAVVLEWDSTYRELVVLSESNITSLNLDSTVISGATSDAYGTLKRRVLHTDAIHHFEDSDKNILNPLPGPLSTSTSPLEGYLTSSQNSLVTEITNREYEERLNRDKKSIKILRPEYISNILADMQKVFK